MPEMLASSHETVFHYRGNVTPPADYDAWATLIRKLVGHWVDRYGVAEVAQSFFEVWNEPNLRRPGEVIHPGRAMGGITRYLERRGVHPARPVAWVVRFPDDRSYTIRFDGERWSRDRGEADADVVVETSPERWVRLTGR